MNVTVQCQMASSLIDLVEKYSPDFINQQTERFERAAEKMAGNLSDSELTRLYQLIKDLPIPIREEVKRIAFELHLKAFSYTRDRADEYTRIERLYVNAAR